MSKIISFKKMAEIILEDTQELLSPKQIWNEAKESSRKEIQEKVKETKGKTPWETIGAQIYVDMKKHNSIFVKPINNAQKFCLKKYENKFEKYKKREKGKLPKKEHHHYIIMLDEKPDHHHPNDRKIKIGYGKAESRLANYWTSNPEAYVYREWIHERNIEGDLLEIANIFGQSQAKPGKRYGSEVFIISKNKLDIFVRHYDENVFKNRIDTYE